MPEQASCSILNMNNPCCSRRGFCLFCLPLWVGLFLSLVFKKSLCPMFPRGGGEAVPMTSALHGGLEIWNLFLVFKRILLSR